MVWLVTDINIVATILMENQFTATKLYGAFENDAGILQIRFGLTEMTQKTDTAIRYICL